MTRNSLSIESVNELFHHFAIIRVNLSEADHISQHLLLLQLLGKLSDLELNENFDILFKSRP